MKVVCATRVGNMKDPNPETRGTVGVLDFPIKELGDDEVLIKVAYCGICGSDPHVVDGCFNKPEDAPFGIGHEMSGVIEKLPQGLDTMIEEHGANLSGGQRQRISIARALIRDPQVIILDEATSALDSISEAEIQEALERLTKGRTTFIVAHRLSTVRGADRILVLSGSRIVEEGNHETLMKQRGIYYQLYTSAGEAEQN